MINLNAELAKDIEDGLKIAAKAGELKLPKKLPRIVVERPDNPEYGDFASPVALALAKAARMSPMDIVAVVAEHMPKREYTGKLEAVAPGFLNIRINPGWMTARLDDLLQEELCPGPADLVRRSVNMEFISANPTGPMTLGNARTAFSADTLGRVLECAGWAVTREYYINDFGGQIRKLGESVARRILQSQGERLEYPEDMYQGDYINEVGAQIAERLREEDGKELEPADLENEEVLAMLGQEAADRLLEGIKGTIENDLQIHFDVWTSERALREAGAVEKVIEKFKKMDALYEKDGAKYLRLGKKKSDEDPVLIKKNGEYTYIVPDLAYHMDKYEREFDLLLTYMGADHLTHSERMRKALELLGRDTDKLKFVVAQWMRLASGGEAVKLSKRRGNIYEPKDLIAEVGYDATRFFMVQHALNTHMDFDLDLAKERSEKNPVYYVQYAYVRLQSILRQAKERGVIDNIGEDVSLSSSAPLTHSAEVALMSELYRLQEVIAGIAENMEVQALAFYARDLAKAVHFFYRHVPVLAADQEDVLMGRLQLVLAARQVMGKTLDLLGISKPEVM